MAEQNTQATSESVQVCTTCGGRFRGDSCAHCAIVAHGDGSERVQRCTGLSASWCPVHGDCTCPRHGDHENPVTSEAMRGEVIGGHMEDSRCPLHAVSSSHAEPALSGSSAGERGL